MERIPQSGYLEFYLFPLPPIKIQQQFDNIAIHVVRVAKNMSDEIDTTLFDSLTQRAFRGEL